MDIRLININKEFDGKKVLQHLDITFRAGTISCIMGPSGSGKTTLANILMGLIKPDSGEIQGLKEVKISAVFQEDRLIEHWDALKNVQLVCGKEITEEVVREHFQKVGLEVLTKKPVRSFSGGMRRRVAMVRALLADSDLILLDEPFKGLDKTLKHRVISYLLEQTVGKTVIVITHEKEDAKLLGAELHTLEKLN